MPFEKEYHPVEKHLPRWVTVLITLAILSCVGAIALYILNQEVPASPPEPSNVLHPQTKARDAFSDWETYRNKEFGFAIDYPSNWKLETHEQQEFFSIPFVRFVTQTAGLDIFVNPPDTKPTGNNRILLEDAVLDIQDAQQAQYAKFYDTTLDTYWLEATIRGQFNNYFVSTFPQPSVSLLDKYIGILSTFRFIKEIDTSNWETYRNEELGFEFRYPRELDEDPIFLKKHCDVKESYDDSKTLTVRGGPLKIQAQNDGAKSPTDYVVEKILKIHKNNQDLEQYNEKRGTNLYHKVLLITETTVSEERALRLVEGFSAANYAEPVSLYVKKGSLIFIFSYDASDDVSGCYNETFPSESQLAEQILSTFRFTKVISSKKTEASPAFIKITSPNGGEKIKMGSTFNVTWDSSYSPEYDGVVIKLVAADGTEYEIAGSMLQNSYIRNSGSYTWTLDGEHSLKYDPWNPYTKYEPGTYKLQIVVVTNSDKSDVSDNFFTIVP